MKTARGISLLKQELGRAFAERSVVKRAVAAKVKRVASAEAALAIVTRVTGVPTLLGPVHLSPSLPATEPRFHMFGVHDRPPVPFRAVSASSLPLFGVSPSTHTSPIGVAQGDVPTRIPTGVLGDRTPNTSPAPARKVAFQRRVTRSQLKLSSVPLSQLEL